MMDPTSFASNQVAAAGIRTSTDVRLYFRRRPVEWRGAIRNADGDPLERQAALVSQTVVGIRMLKIGDRAPDFSATTTAGRAMRLSELRGRPVILYFFPRAFTFGCTLETKRFQENYGDIRDLGAELFGISTDPLETQCRFAEEHKAGFAMIGDSDCAISRAYGVLRPLLGGDKRVTYAIDEQGLIGAVFHHELQVTRHVSDVIRWLRGRGRPLETHAR
jgi:peroxiredoxin Q/BCP